MKRSVFLFAALAALSFPASAAMIDDFGLTAPPTGYAISPGPNPTEIVTDLGGGTTRTFTAQVTSALFPNALSGNLGGGFLLANFAFGAAGSLQLHYTFSTPRDFSTDFALQLVGASPPSATPLTLAIQTATGTLSLSTALPQSGALATTLFRFTDFTGTGDLSQVQSVQAILLGSSSTSLALDSFAAVPTPEPGTLAVFLLAGPMMYLARRKR